MADLGDLVDMVGTVGIDMTTAVTTAAATTAEADTMTTGAIVVIDDTSYSDRQIIQGSMELFVFVGTACCANCVCTFGKQLGQQKRALVVPVQGAADACSALDAYVVGAVERIATTLRPKLFQIPFKDGEEAGDQRGESVRGEGGRSGLYAENRVKKPECRIEDHFPAFASCREVRTL